MIAFILSGLLPIEILSSSWFDVTSRLEGLGDNTCEPEFFKLPYGSIYISREKNRKNVKRGKAKGRGLSDGQVPNQMLAPRGNYLTYYPSHLIYVSCLPLQFFFFICFFLKMIDFFFFSLSPVQFPLFIPGEWKKKEKKRYHLNFWNLRWGFSYRCDFY